MNKFSLEKCVFFLLAIAGIQWVFFPGHTTRVAIQFFLFVVICVLLSGGATGLLAKCLDFKKLLWVYFYYGCVVVVHSIFVAKSYEEWRYLSVVFVPTLLFPVFSMLSASTKSFFYIFEVFIKNVFPLSFIFWFVQTNDKNDGLFYVYYAAYIYLVSLFFWYSSSKYRIVILAALISSFAYDLANRANMLSVILSVLILLVQMIVYKKILFSNSKGREIFSLLRRIFLFGPLVLVAAALLFNFNPFVYIQESAGSVVVAEDALGRPLVVDSRTGIYLDAYNYLNKENAWMFGGSAVASPDTVLAESNEGYDDGRLGGSESGFLTLLVYGGIAYVFIYFAICYLSSYLAIYSSNNLLCKSLGVFIAMRWALSFLESPLLLNFLWIVHFVAIGLALCPEFRKLTDKQLISFGRNNWKCET
ncbi:hypothetical protein [Uliginosibacterium gangwonense]|uniref:hypothetical protein n=1 Tax=Uliginosibacterium gangwonense TaxID=392736 RepID=UPI00037FD7B0|nr:hypothetical protein [Uliginosibacterium gangwonense]